MLGVKYYYCCQCLDEKKDPMYKPLSKRLYYLYYYIDQNGSKIKPKGKIEQFVK